MRYAEFEVVHPGMDGHPGIALNFEMILDSSSCAARRLNHVHERTFGTAVYRESYKCL